MDVDEERTTDDDVDDEVCRYTYGTTCFCNLGLSCRPFFFFGAPSFPQKAPTFAY